MIVILDSGVLYSLISQSSVQVVIDCKRWFEQLLIRSVLVVSSEICDYEVRRELIRRNNQEVIENLEQLRKGIDFLPINHKTLVIASNFWAIARNQNQPTASERNIDADMIISAQWQILNTDYPGRQVIVATTNLRHLRRFTNAREWQDIK